MTKLLIDIGNSALKWQLRQKDDVMLFEHHRVDVPIAVMMESAMNQGVEAIFVASVNSPKLDHALCEWAREHMLPMPVFIASSAKACGVSNAYSIPEQLGVDRWLAMIGAHQKHMGLKCIVDSGTALTLDVVDDKGKHIGGYIVPGEQLQRDMLLQQTQRIETADEVTDGDLGVNTTQAVLGGIQQMLCAFIQSQIQRLESLSSGPIQLILTGGHAEQLAAGLRIPYVIEKDLVFHGLHLLVSE